MPATITTTPRALRTFAAAAGLGGPSAVGATVPELRVPLAVTVVVLAVVVVVLAVAMVVTAVYAPAVYSTRAFRLLPWTTPTDPALADNVILAAQRSDGR